MRHLYSMSVRPVSIVTASLMAVVLSGAIAPLGAQQGAPQAAQQAAPKAVQQAPPQAAQPAAQTGETYNVARATQLRSAPDATALGQLRAGSGVEVLSRSRGWVRVRAEGWVKEADLTPADTAFRAHLSAADIKSEPTVSRGKMVQWTVEFLALQTADPLRHGLADDEPYMLARGPAGENSLLYLVIPPSLMGTARALQPLAKVAVTARVRDGRSEPVGIPILDLQTIRRVQ